MPTQPAEQEYAVVQMSDIADVGKRPCGIRYPGFGDELAASGMPGDVVLR